MKINHFREKVATLEIDGIRYGLLEVGGNLAITKPDGSTVKFKRGSLKLRLERGLNLRKAVKDILVVTVKTKAVGTECLIITGD